MEAVALALASKAIKVLAPYVKKGFEKFAGDVGEVAAKKVKGLFDTIKARLAGDKFASDSLERFEKKPEAYMDSVKEVLKDKLVEDKNFEKELDGLLKELGPIIEIFQDVKVVKGKLIGIDADKMTRGKGKVTQRSDEITENGEVVGAKFGEIS